jgi:hypothetical protein
MTYKKVGKVRLHRALMEQQLGRKLNTDEVVHHKNGDKLDNRLENLELFSRSGHSVEHQLGSKHSAAERARIGNSRTRANGKYSVLTEETVLEIRRLVALGVTYKEITETLNVSRSTAHRVGTYQVWQHI